MAQTPGRISSLAPPIASLRKNPPFTLILWYIFITISLLAFGTAITLYHIIGPTAVFEWKLEISIPPQSIILFILMIIPTIISLIRGYRSIKLEVPHRPREKNAEGWANNLTLTFKTFGKRAYFAFSSPERIAKAQQTKFVRYLADPYEPGSPSNNPSYSWRAQTFQLGQMLVISMSVACMPFKQQEPGFDVFWQGLGTLMVMGTCYSQWNLAWNHGWTIKMGRIARHIRRECLDVRGLDDIEKEGRRIDPKARLEWWIRESWKGCDDRGDSLKEGQPKITSFFDSLRKKKRRACRHVSQFSAQSKIPSFFDSKKEL